jgi:hypothetical protein
MERAAKGPARLRMGTRLNVLADGAGVALAGLSAAARPARKPSLLRDSAISAPSPQQTAATGPCRASSPLVPAFFLLRADSLLEVAAPSLSGLGRA